MSWLKVRTLDSGRLVLPGTEPTAMPSVARSYTLPVLEEPLSKAALHRRGPASRSKLVSAVLGLLIHQTKVSPAGESQNLLLLHHQLGS